jgi:hypothetical protein
LASLPFIDLPPSTTPPRAFSLPKPAKTKTVADNATNNVMPATTIQRFGLLGKRGDG